MKQRLENLVLGAVIMLAFILWSALVGACAYFITIMSAPLWAKAISWIVFGLFALIMLIGPIAVTIDD